MIMACRIIRRIQWVNVSYKMTSKPISNNINNSNMPKKQTKKKKRRKKRAKKERRKQKQQKQANCPSLASLNSLWLVPQAPQDSVSPPPSSLGPCPAPSGQLGRWGSIHPAYLLSLFQGWHPRQGPWIKGQGTLVLLPPLQPGSCSGSPHF